mgnify:CR=1 FL=1
MLKNYFNIIYFLLTIKKIGETCQPLLFAMLLEYFNNTIQLSQALLIAFIISVIGLFCGALDQYYFFNLERVSLRIRLACFGLIYRKVMFQI